MNFLPIAERELRLLARKSATYYVRSFAGLLASLISVGIIYASFSRVISVTSAGQKLFITLSILAWLYVSFEGILVTCDSISQEKRDGTLGLLFLTDLKGYDIIAGKLVARASRSFYCLLAILPAPAFAFFLGGISVGDFLYMVLALLNALFFSAALGLLISTLVRRAHVAVGLALGLISLSLIWPALGFIASGTSTPLSHFFLALPSPGGAMLAALGSTPPRLPLHLYATSFWTSHLAAWGFLALASYLLPKSFAAGAVLPPKVTVFNRPVWQKLKPNPLSATADFPDLLRTPDKNNGGLHAVFAVAIIASVPLGVATIFHRYRWLGLPLFASTAFTLHLILKLQATGYACRALTQQRQNGELELLLTTPFDEDQILRSCLLSIKRQIFRPFIFILGVDMILVLVGWYQIGFWEGVPWGLAAVFEIIWLLFNLYSIAWVGLYLGLKSNTLVQAARRTIVYILLLPWLGVLISIGLFGLCTRGAGFNNPAAGFLGVAWFLILVALCNFGFTGWAISQLRDKFRILVSHS